LVQDIPPSPVLYLHKGIIPVDGIQTLVYVKPDPTQEEALVGDNIGEDDVGVTKEFAA